MSNSADRLQHALAGRYAIEKELGRGGMATVYLARDLKHDRPVAIKLLGGDSPWAHDPERFLREIRLAAQLSHPNVLGLIDSGAGDGLLWYVMPYVDGATLRERLAQGPPLELAAAVRVLRDVAAALAHAHERGVVHRDVKPENVLLTGEHALVADFGVAKVLDAAQGERGITTAGVAVGTPGYMAPEQVAADPVVDHRADLYAWGAVAYETLTGSPLFPGRTPAATMAAQIAELPPAPGTLRPGLPPALDALVMRCLAKNPADRPERAAQVVAALDAVDLRNVRRPVRWPAVAGAVAVVAALLATGWLLAGRGSSASGPGGGGAASTDALSSLAVLPLAQIGGDSTTEHFAHGMSEALTTALAKVPGLRVSTPGGGDISAVAGRDPVELARSAGADAVLGGTLQRSGSRVRVTARLTRASDGTIVWSDAIEREWTDVFALQDEFSRAIVRALRIPLGAGSADSVGGAVRVATADTVAYNLYLLGRLHWSRRTAAGVTAAEDHFRRALARDSSFALAWAGLADALVLRPAYNAARPADAYPPARAAAERAVALDSTLAEGYTTLGLVTALYDHDYAASGRAFARALALQPGYALAHHWHGIVLALRGEADSAVRSFERAALLDPLSLVLASQLGLMYLLDGRLDDAVAQGRRAVALDSGFVRGRYELAWTLALRGDHAAALRELDQVTRASGDSLPLERAWLDAARGDTARARARLRAVERCCLDPAAMGRFGFEYGSAVLAAWVYGAVGEGDRAFRVLEASVGARVMPGFLLLDPRYDPLRGDARFGEVVGRLGLGLGRGR